MTFAVTIHLSSGQSLRGEVDTTTDPDWAEYEDATEWAVLSRLMSLISGTPGWRTVAGLLVYSQVVSAIEVEQIGGSQ